MTLAMSRSRDGFPICSADGILLHSSYDPGKEAERFLDSRRGQAAPSTYVLLGPCLDYLSPLIRRRYPGSRIVSLQYSAFFRGKEIQEADATWYPDSPISLPSFIEAAIGEEASSGIGFLDWAPSARAFPDMARLASAVLRDSLDRLASSAATIKATGRSWLLNTCRAFLLAEEAASPIRADGPLVVAMAGPSLESALGDLHRFRGSFRLVSSSSALASCLANGFQPDLVVATDGGFWSRSHLYPLASVRLHLACPLSALPSGQLYKRTPLVLLDQGSFAESELLPFLGGGHPLPAHGTVAGSALALSSSLGEGPLIVAGLDLADLGEREHARPHGFDRVVDRGTGRGEPLETVLFARRLGGARAELGLGWSGTRSHAVYASALELDALRLRGRTFRLRPSPRRLAGFDELDGAALAALLDPAGLGGAGPLRFEERPLPSSEARRDFLSAKLSAWRESSSRACFDLAEGRRPSDPRMDELLRSFDHPYWAAARRALASGGDPRPAAEALAERVADGLSSMAGRLF